MRSTNSVLVGSMIDNILTDNTDQFGIHLGFVTSELSYAIYDVGCFDSAPPGFDPSSPCFFFFQEDKKLRNTITDKCCTTILDDLLPPERSGVTLHKRHHIISFLLSEVRIKYVHFF